MLFLAMPAFIVSLVPIILIESVYLSRKLGLPGKKMLKVTTAVNLVSTLVGIPLTWVVLVAIEMAIGGGSAYGIDTTTGKVLAVTLQAPWLVPYESDLVWMIPIAGTFLLVPFFFASWWSEYFVARKMLLELDPNLIRSGVRNANLITYSLMLIWPLGWWLLK